MLNPKKVLEKLEVSNLKELTSELLESKKSKLSEEEYQFAKTKLETISKGKKALALLKNKKGELSEEEYQNAEKFITFLPDEVIKQIQPYFENSRKSDTATTHKILDILSQQESAVRENIMKIIKDPNLSSEEKDRYIKMLENRETKNNKIFVDIDKGEKNNSQIKLIIFGGVVVFVVIAGTGNLAPVIGAVGTAVKSTARLVFRNPKATFAFIRGLVA